MKRHVRFQAAGCAALRNGFSILEVIIATAILMGSAIVLARLAGMGREQSVRAALRSEALQLCEMTLNELLLGQRPLQPVNAEPVRPPMPDGLSQFPESGIDDGTDPGFNELADAGEATAFAAGVTEAATSTSDADSTPWLHSVLLEPRTDLPGLWSLTVVVHHNPDITSTPMAVALTRWIQGPVTAELELPSSEFGDPLNSSSFGESRSPADNPFELELRGAR